MRPIHVLHINTTTYIYYMVHRTPIQTEYVHTFRRIRGEKPCLLFETINSTILLAHCRPTSSSLFNGYRSFICGIVRQTRTGVNLSIMGNGTVRFIRYSRLINLTPREANPSSRIRVLGLSDDQAPYPRMEKPVKTQT